MFVKTIKIKKKTKKKNYIKKTKQKQKTKLDDCVVGVWLV